MNMSVRCMQLAIQLKTQVAWYYIPTVYSYVHIASYLFLQQCFALKFIIVQFSLSFIIMLVSFYLPQFCLLHFFKLSHVVLVQFIICMYMQFGFIIIHCSFHYHKNSFYIDLMLSNNLSSELCRSVPSRQSSNITI